MRSPVRACRTISKMLAGAVLLMMIPPCFSNDDAEDSPGWSPQHLLPAAPWEEQQLELSAYPEKGNLLNVNISTGGQAYTLYLDTRSVQIGDDSVVRYTVVMISSSGIWNVSHEGLHCGERKQRRYAYGYDGEWRKLENSQWKALSGMGVNQYRILFYNEYMCNQADNFSSAREIINKFRSSDYGNEY